MRRLLALLATVALAVGLTAAPASAVRVSGRDGVGDVAREGRPADGGVARPTVDLVGYSIRYSERRITATLRYRDLQPRGRTFFAGLLFTAAGRDSSDSLQVIAGRGNRAGESMLDGRERCPTTHRIDYRRDVVRVSMPARCIGAPRYIDAFAGTYVFARRGNALFIDIAPGTYRDFVRADDDDYPTVRVRRG
ncbi:hypothetical protein GCM10023340_18320 [Nocardioides marinquilinus]|uniref:Uncharacterized protein n=1 Tax=Nocardioides marinquilinus TaxID=1210400 RepID=A0ABP9PHT7_9ACTN